MKKIEETIVQTCIKIARRGEGALIVLGNHIKYKSLVKQKIPAFNIVKNAKLLEVLAIMDGAVIIDNKGFLKAYGVMIETNKVLKGFGTRHVAAVSAAKDNNLVYLVSEEDRKIKVFRKGRIVMQIDPFEKNIEKNLSTTNEWLESLGAGAIGSIGATAIVPTLGITLVPGIILFGSAWYLSKMITKRFG
ncbi:MAG: DNA integrity scanning protein DisA nucleotide-binding domain protein [Nitrososphaerales archaeon]